MGVTTIQTIITNLEGNKKVTGEFLVDTGTAYTVVPKKMAESLGLKPIKSQKFSLADGTTVQRKLGSAIVKIDGNEAASTVVIGQ